VTRRADRQLCHHPGKTQKNCPVAIAIEYGGVNFVVPNGNRNGGTCDKNSKKYDSLEGVQCSAGRSMQALSLLTQLIALQKSAKDTPTTGLIRAIAQ
jgi:hypothetical protein